jgi:biotin-independent malonate decarboxylase beta subunit/biotin-independent malonate decarboxylase gamma subunit
MSARKSFLEASARERVLSILDPHSFQEFCPPSERLVSPHLAQLSLSQAFDDGIVTGAGMVSGHKVLIAAQEGRFNGGSVGEIHGAKLVGLLHAAILQKPSAVLLMIDSGGVRLHEANAGIIAISEISRAILDVRAEGIPVLVMLGGSCGAFGGMGIVVRLCHSVFMSEEGRLSLSGPEVIETVMGREEFDSKDRALVWRITGGKLRRALGEVDRLIEDDLLSFREAASEWLANQIGSVVSPLTYKELCERQMRLLERCKEFEHARDGREILAKKLSLNETQWTLANSMAFESALNNSDIAPVTSQSDSWKADLDALNKEDQAFADRLFGVGQHQLQYQGYFLVGKAQTLRGPVHVIGTRDRAPIGVELALKLSSAVLAAIAEDQKNGTVLPIVLISETQGQLLSRHDELLGLNGTLAHVALCVDLARRMGHRLLTLVRHEAVSGGFLSFGMLGDRICALPDSQVRVMDLRAMARVTKIPLERLEGLAQQSAVFAPGAENYVRLGGVHEQWTLEDDWSQSLATALDHCSAIDERASLGAQRGGRHLAASTAERVKQQAIALA